MAQRGTLVLFAAFVLGIAVACGGESVEPAGPTSTEERAASAFVSVAIDGPLEVTVRLKRGAPERIEVTAPAAGHERVVTTLEDGALTISARDEPLEGTSVLLVVPTLEAITAHAGASVSLAGEVELPIFEAVATADASIVARDVIGIEKTSGSWQLRAEDSSTIDLAVIVASSVTVEASGRSSITLDALTSVIGTVAPGATLEVIGSPGRVDVTGGGFVRAEPADPTPPTDGAVAPRSDQLAGAPLPALETESVTFDEGRFKPNAGTFPALTDPAVVPAEEARWLDDDTLVLGATQNGEARAYPIFQLQFHHVANDTLGGKPYLITF